MLTWPDVESFSHFLSYFTVLIYSEGADSVKIAIIGSGIAGLVCAHALHPHHQITVLEANDYVGGHTHTVNTPAGHQVDTGFIVFNKERYPNFLGLLNALGVANQPTTMSFSMRCDQTKLEYSTASINHLFAQRRNFLNLPFYRMLREIVQFNHHVTALAGQLPHDMTVAEYLQRYQFSDYFRNHFLLPMGAALWSCPGSSVMTFPIRFILEFYGHHGMHQFFSMPQWHVVQGGSSRYVVKLITPFQDCIRLRCPVLKVNRHSDRVEIFTRQGSELFDEVIFACHSDQALRILDKDATPLERELLDEFPFTDNAVTLHTDTSVLPRRRRAWSCWNYRTYAGPERHSTVTYNMNKLQTLHARDTYCVSLNQDDKIRSQHVLQRFTYAHPRFTTRRSSVQARHQEVIRQHRTSFCGAYWGNGFHEAGVVSALRVCRAYHVVPQWAMEPFSCEDRISA